MSEELHPLDELKEIMERLRGENGCPWDLEQTHKSLIPCLIEESYEVVDAIEREDFAGLKEELGDLLFQSVFHSQLAKEEGRFDLYDVIRGISEKLVRRHPHVFGDTVGIHTAEQVVGQWESIKDQEKMGKANLEKSVPNANANQESVLDQIPHSFPAILRAGKIQSKVAKLGFDWENWQEPIQKLWEEVGELKDELDELNKFHNQERKIQKDQIPDELLGKIESEMGDVLFSIVNVARHLGLDPETALRKTNDKFSRRFRFMEREVNRTNRSFKNMNLSEMDEIWNQAKKNESARP
jgi:MazG family protein